VGKQRQIPMEKLKSKGTKVALRGEGKKVSAREGGGRGGTNKKTVGLPGEEREFCHGKKPRRGGGYYYGKMRITRGGVSFSGPNGSNRRVAQATGLQNLKQGGGVPVPPKGLKKQEMPTKKETGGVGSFDTS